MAYDSRKWETSQKFAKLDKLKEGYGEKLREAIVPVMTEAMEAGADDLIAMATSMIEGGITFIQCTFKEAGADPEKTAELAASLVYTIADSLAEKSAKPKI